MNVSHAVSASRFAVLSLALISSATLTFGDPPVLRWNGPAAGTNLWNAAATWLDAGDSAVAWLPGAEARFTGTGGVVNIAADVAASNITFTGSGYVLLGAGRLTVEGSVSAAAFTTNTIAADLLTVAGVSKTGAGEIGRAHV